MRGIFGLPNERARVTYRTVQAQLITCRGEAIPVVKTEADPTMKSVT
jgi:hypothetical protein